MPKTLMRLACIGGVAAGVGVVGACVEESVQRQVTGLDETALMSESKSGSRTPEEEVFGRIVVSDTSGWWIYLWPSDSLPDGSSDDMPGQAVDATNVRWGWYEVVAGGYCPPIAQDSTEQHEWNGNPYPGTYEKHCLEMGTAFTVDIEQDEELMMRREVDWEQWRSFIAESISYAVDDEYVTGGSTWADVLVDYWESSSETVTPKVEITAARSANEASWDTLAVDSGYYHIPQNYIVRLGAFRTTTTADKLERVLFRYFWDYPDDKDLRTGFVSIQADYFGGGLVRTHEYSDSSTPDTVKVLGHFVLPHERPDTLDDMEDIDYGDTLSLSLVIAGNLTANVSASDNTVVVGDTVTFSDTGADGAGIDSVRWDFGDGVGTSADSAPSYAYSNGDTSYTTVLTKWHKSWVKAVDSTTVLVVDSIVAGPILGDYEGDPEDHRIEGRQSFCSWSVSAEGGYGGRTYDWYLNGSYEESGQHYAVRPPRDDFDLMVIVTDQAEQADTVIVEVDVTPKGQVCLMK